MRDTSMLEEEEKDSFADIDDILNTRTGMVRKRVGVVIRSGRRAVRAAYSK